MAPEDPALAEPFVKQATEAGVARFVALSGRGIEQITGDHFQGMAAGEQAVRDSGAEWTIIRPNNFSQNFDEDLWCASLRAGRLALPAGSVPEPFIDAQDIADVAAVLLTSDGHHGQVYDLSGPRALSFGTAVAAIARAAGRSIRYVELSPDEYRAQLLAEAASEDDAAELNAMFDMMRAGRRRACRRSAASTRPRTSRFRRLRRSGSRSRSMVVGAGRHGRVLVLAPGGGAVEPRTMSVAGSRRERAGRPGSSMQSSSMRAASAPRS